MNTRKTAIMWYFLCALALIMILTYGSNVSHTVIEWVDTGLNGVEIKDVKVSIEDGAELLAGKSYSLNSEVTGKYRRFAGIEYTSLNPEYLTVSDDGVLYATKAFEGDTLEAGIKITSKYDTDYEKTLSFTFVKKYPSDFKIAYRLRGHSYSYTNTGETVKKLYMGVPVYVYSYVTSTDPYNMGGYTIIYDEEYFEKRADGAYVPIKPTPAGETVRFGVTYGSDKIVETQDIVILPYDLQAVEIDNIVFSAENAAGTPIIKNPTPDGVYEVEKGSNIVLDLYKNGEKVASDYTLTFSDPGDVTMSVAGNFSFKTPGKKTLTLTFPNGKEETIRISVRSYVTAPKITDTSVEKSKYIRISTTDVKKYSFTFDGDVTSTDVQYEYDASVISLTASSSGFTVTPVAVGATTLKMTVDDGVSRAETTYTVEVKEDRSLGTIIANNVKTFVSKVLGHGVMFFILAFFSMHMFKFLNVDNLILRFSIYTLSAFWVGCVSEYIQTFIPGRTGRFLDVLIDLTGFYIGTLIIVFSRCVINLVREVIILIKGFTKKDEVEA